MPSPALSESRSLVGGLPPPRGKGARALNRSAPILSTPTVDPMPLCLRERPMESALPKPADETVYVNGGGGWR